MAMSGINHPAGSFEENLAILAINRKKQVHFLTTLTIVNAIIHVGNSIQSALSGGSSSSKSGEKLQKQIEALRDALIPDDAFEKESSTERALRILEEETSKGPLVVRPMVEGKKDRGRITRRRSK